MGLMHQVKEGVKSCVRVSVATAIGGPAVGGVVLVTEVARSAATAVAGEEGTKAGNIVSTAMDASSAVTDRD